MDKDKHDKTMPDLVLCRTDFDQMPVCECGCGGFRLACECNNTALEVSYHYDGTIVTQCLMCERKLHRIGLADRRPADEEGASNNPQ